MSEPIEFVAHEGYDLFCPPTPSHPWRLEFIRKEDGTTERALCYASPFLAEQARKVADKADDAHLFRRRVVGPNPWPHL